MGLHRMYKADPDLGADAIRRRETIPSLQGLDEFSSGLGYDPSIKGKFHQSHE